MILILTKKGEQSVTEVALWLNYYAAPFKRVNVEEINKDVGTIQIADQGSIYQLAYKDIKIDFAEINIVWFWHGVLQAHIPQKIKEIEKGYLKDSFNKYLRKEYTSLLGGFYISLENKRSLGKFHTYQVNKIESLQVASSLGLKVPGTLITTSRDQLKSFKKKYNQIITKGIQGVFRAILDEQVYANYTEIVNDDFIDSLSDSFYPSLFQELLIKKYELRIFYLQDQFYSAAIFSQLDEKTKIDFRKYNNENPNRIVPFNLPAGITIKLKKLMSHLHLDTGSIDMVVTTDNQFVFLEVNPVGQYGFISDWCNYYLDKTIAQSLKFNSTS